VRRKDLEGEKFVIRGTFIESNAVIEFAVQFFLRAADTVTLVSLLLPTFREFKIQSSDLSGLKRDKAMPHRLVSLK